MNVFHTAALVFFVISCNSSNSMRTPANYDDGNQEIYEIGEVKTSLLEPSQFQERYGEAWVLMDGQDVTDSEFEKLTSFSSVPDARGKFLRMNNNMQSCESDGGDVNCSKLDPENGRSLGSYQGDAIRNITGHLWGRGIENGGASGGNGVFRGYARGSYGGGHGSNAASFAWQFNASKVVPTAKDNRPKNVSVNFYIKINSCDESDSVCK